MPAPDTVYAPRSAPRALASDPEAETHVSAMLREGYVVLPELLSRDEVAAMRTALSPHLQGKRMGRNDFEGFCTERVYALLAKDPALALLVEHPRLLAIVDRLLAPHYLLSAFLAINVHPGETPQGWHFDDGGCHVPRPRPMYGVSAIWALDEFTEQNGATQVIPKRKIPASMSAARNLQIASAFDMFSQWFDDPTAREFFGPDAVIGGALNPPRRAVPSTGG